MKKLPISNILVAVDFSPLSAAALKAAQRLAERCEATLHLANVQVYSYPVGSLAPLAPVPVSPLLGLEDRRIGADRALRVLAKRHGLNGSCRAEIGSAPFDVLCGIAEEVKADLIVTGTHGRKGFRRFFLGSTAERLVQYSPCPVMVVGGKSEASGASERRSLRIDRIVVPVDFSKCSFEGLQYAIGFARRFGGEILALHAIDAGYAYKVEGLGVRDLSIYEEQSLVEARHDIAAFVGAADFGGVRYQTAIKFGLPEDCICDFADNEQAGLIITSTHGYTGLKHVLVGSIAERVVRQAHCPVLVVPSYPEVRKAQTPGQSHMAASVTRKTSASIRKPELERFVDARSKKDRKILAHPFPEPRRINKFRESPRRFLGRG
jgi:nucleotide-binding universal stress UspA family protein